MNTEKKAVGIGISVPGTLPLPAAEGANFFHFTVIGEEVQLLVGTINLIRLHEAKERGETGVIVPDITHRFLLSPLGFASLKTNLEEIAKSVPKSQVGIEAKA